MMVQGHLGGALSEVGGSDGSSDSHAYSNSSSNIGRIFWIKSFAEMTFGKYKKQMQKIRI